MEKREEKKQALNFLLAIGKKEKQIKQIENEIFDLLDQLSSLCGEDISFFYPASPSGLIRLKETIFSILEDVENDEKLGRKI